MIATSPATSRRCASAAGLIASRAAERTATRSRRAAAVAAVVTAFVSTVSCIRRPTLAARALEKPSQFLQRRRIAETPALAGSAAPTDAIMAAPALHRKADGRETQHEVIGFFPARDFLPLANQVAHVANACEVTGDDPREARAAR